MCGRNKEVNMNRTVSIPAADNALVEMLAQKLGWGISHNNKNEEDIHKPYVAKNEKKKDVLEALQAVAGTLATSQLDDWKQAKEEQLRAKYL